MDPRRAPAPSAGRASRVSEAERARWVAAAQSDTLIALGMIMGSHGLHGQLRVKQYNAESDALLTTPLLILRTKAGVSAVHAVVSVKPADKGLFLQLADVNAIEQAKTLHGAELLVPRHELPALAAGEFYYADLPGLLAVTPSGENIGKVQRVIEYPAASVLSVELPQGVIEVPMREPYLLAVDVAAGRVTIDQLADLDVQTSRRKAE